LKQLADYINVQSPNLEKIKERNFLKSTTSLRLLLLSFPLLIGCAGAPVVVGDGKIEKPLEQVTGLATSDVEKASQKTELNLWDVYAMAVEKTEDLATKAEDIEQASAQSQQAIASILPQIAINDRKNWQSNSYIFGTTNSIITPLGNTVYLSGTENLLTGLNQVAAIQGAQALTDENHHLFKQEARNLLLNVARAYYTVLQNLDAQQSKQEILNLTEQILAQEQQWKAIGRSRESDVLTTEAQLAQLKGDLESIHGQLSRAQDSLSILSGLNSGQALKSEEQAVAPAYTMEEAKAKVDSRSDVIAAKSAVAVADAELLQAHGEHLPSLSFEGQYFLQQDGGSPTPDWNVQLVASLPLFEGGAILAQERAAASRKRQAELQYSLIRRQALIDIQGSYSALATALRELDAYGKALDAAQRDYKAVERDRRLALNTNLDVLQALTQLQNAETNYNQAHYQVLIDWVWLGTATGELPRTTK